VRIQEGEGWRVVLDPARSPFAVLVGGDGWAAELTLAEARALRRAVLRLRGQHGELAPALMAEEAVTLELETPLGEAEGDSGAGGVLWLELEGDRSAWSLRFVLTPGPEQRAIEGSWSAAASRSLAAVLEMEIALAER
jgi:hypothetical protein